MQVHDLHLRIRMLNAAKESIYFDIAKKKRGIFAKKQPPK